MQELKKVSEDELRSIEDDVRKEAAEDAEQRQKYGQKWARPGSVALNSQINEKIAGVPSSPSLPFHPAEWSTKLVETLAP